MLSASVFGSAEKPQKKKYGKDFLPINNYFKISSVARAGWKLLKGFIKRANYTYQSHEGTQMAFTESTSDLIPVICRAPLVAFLVVY